MPYDIALAERFISDGGYGKDYKLLLERVMETCREAKRELGSDAIDDIYTRSADGGPIFKEAAKIAGKVRRRGWPVGDASFLKLGDIIGLTVVIRYPDQITIVADKIRDLLRKRKIGSTKPEFHKNKNGYYATHVTCSQIHSGERLLCEIQFKTMLHDAWAAKMHDLTYKPFGILDPRLGALMASIAATIESLEEQSVLVRDMIRASWNVEEETRRVARQQTFEAMMRYGEETRKTMSAKARSDKARSA